MTTGANRITRLLHVLKDETPRTPEAQRPQGHGSRQRGRARDHGHQRHGSRGDSRAGGENRFAQSDDQEQLTTFQHMTTGETDILRMQPTSRDRMRQPPADQINPGGHPPPKETSLRAYDGACNP